MQSLHHKNCMANGYSSPHQPTLKGLLTQDKGITTSNIIESYATTHRGEYFPVEEIQKVWAHYSFEFELLLGLTVFYRSFMYMYTGVKYETKFAK